MTYCQSKELQNTDKNHTVLTTSAYSYNWLKVENNTHTHLLLKSLVGEEKGC